MSKIKITLQAIAEVILAAAVVFVLFMTLLYFVQPANAQSVTRKGNTFIQQPSEKKIKKDSAVTLTSYTFEINGVTYPVYKSSKGSYFIIRIKKDGTGTYRQYVTKEIKSLL